MLVTSRPGLEAAARQLRPPWVLKATGLLHKSDAGGVRMGLNDVGELAASYDDLVHGISPAGCVLEETAEAAGGVELIAGLRRDPQFGLIAMVGIGGIYTELLADAQVGLAPLTPGQILAMLSRLRGAALLTGARGRPPLDIEAAARLIALVTKVAAEHPEITELEVNPVLVTTAGALALDARIGT
jgi:acyl-CoA synthetase (NDP forming)